MLSPRERLNLVTSLISKVATVAGHIDIARQLLTNVQGYSSASAELLEAVSNLNTAAQVASGIDCSVFFNLAANRTADSTAPIKLFGGPYDGLLIQNYATQQPDTVVIGMKALEDDAPPRTECYLRDKGTPSLFGHLPGFETGGRSC